MPPKVCFTPLLLCRSASDSGLELDFFYNQRIREIILNTSLQNTVGLG